MTDPVRDIQDCPRCGFGHRGVVFARFNESPRLLTGDGLVRFEHWALCPATGEPIMIDAELTKQGVADAV